jgi:hypothetical protein
LGFSAEAWEKLPPDEQAGRQKEGARRRKHLCNFGRKEKAAKAAKKRYHGVAAVAVRKKKAAAALAAAPAHVRASRENFASLWNTLTTREAEREAALPNTKRPKTQQPQFQQQQQQQPQQPQPQ